MSKKPELMWHIVSTNAQGEPVLGYMDNRIVRKGETLSMRVYGRETNLRPSLCKRGMHACRRLIDCLSHAYGNVICRVELSGYVKHDHEKSVGMRRTVLQMTSNEAGERILREFARYAALQVAHLWKEMPAQVRKYLEDGNEADLDAAIDAINETPLAWGRRGECARRATMAALRCGNLSTIGAARAAVQGACEAAGWATGDSFFTEHSKAMTKMSNNLNDHLISLVEAEFAKQGAADE